MLKLFGPLHTQSSLSVVNETKWSRTSEAESQEDGAFSVRTNKT